MFGGWVFVLVALDLVGEDDRFCSGIIKGGVGPKIFPEGLNHVRDGGSDCTSCQLCFVG